ncbi:MAG: Rieske 2Fe-2S domain-containing protein [Polyangiaceae bacterium]
MNDGPVRMTYPPYDVVVVKTGEDVFALEDACNHAGASLSDGDVEDDCISCPMHGYLFSIRTGALVAPKGLCGPQRTYRVERRGNDVLLWDDEPIQILP